jgi:hypothetical protein
MSKYQELKEQRKVNLTFHKEIASATPKLTLWERIKNRNKQTGTSNKEVEKNVELQKSTTTKSLIQTGTSNKEVATNKPDVTAIYNQALKYNLFEEKNNFEKARNIRQLTNNIETYKSLIADEQKQNIIERHKKNTEQKNDNLVQQLSEYMLSDNFIFDDK